MPQAIIPAAIGAIGGAVASRNSSKQAQSAAEAERGFLERSAAPSRALEEAQLEDYREIYRPQAQLQRDLFLQYGRPQAETANRLYQESAGLFSDVYSPAYRGAQSRVLGDLNEEYGLPKDISDQLFQTARRRISENYAPFREAAGQRLAARGSTDSGIAEQVFSRLDDAELQDLADAAFQQALAEFDIERTGRQQSVDNLMRYLGFAPSPQAPGVSAAATSTSAIGNTLPYLRELYSPPVPEPGINFADVIRGAYGGYNAAQGYAGAGASPVMYGRAF